MLGHSDLLTSTVDKAGSQPHLASLHTPCTGYQYINNLSFKIAVLVWECVHNVPHCQIPSPVKTEWRLISATLWGWRRCFVADQLWFVTRIQEEEVCPRCCPWCLLHNYTLHPLDVSSCSFVDTFWINLLLSPKFGLRPKISEKVKSFFVWTQRFAERDRFRTEWFLNPKLINSLVELHGQDRLIG